MYALNNVAFYLPYDSGFDYCSFLGGGSVAVDSLLIVAPNIWGGGGGLVLVLLCSP